MNLRQQLKVINNTIKELKGKLFIKATIDSNLITDSAEKIITPIHYPLIALIIGNNTITHSRNYETRTD